MTTHVESQPALAVDEARRELCQRMATAMRAGAVRFQLRFLRQNDVVSEVWLYTYQSHAWQKRDDLAIPARLSPSLWDQMEMVSSREVADFESCRRVDHSDRVDIELSFRREAIESHLTGDLESFLNGCLFHGHHDSGQDSRRRMGFRGRP